MTGLLKTFAIVSIFGITSTDAIADTSNEITK